MAKVAIVPSSWLGMIHSWNPRALVKMAERVKATGTDPHDLETVRTVCLATDAETVAEMRRIRDELRELDIRRKKLRDALELLQPILPVEGWNDIKKGKR